MATRSFTYGLTVGRADPALIMPIVNQYLLEEISIGDRMKARTIKGEFSNFRSVMIPRRYEFELNFKRLVCSCTTLSYTAVSTKVVPQKR